ncbi:BZ3500-MvSof-1268-A1-R1-Chr11-3g03607 protein [Mycena venus]|uniref:Glutathione hydrolase n=1 Tax=Mycena venus TaxID=2733690 RepID=A0A8H7CLP2_9AGAR|nr:BZ3500-MvSof-1268-A1-R1-Chr11-3g03607 protein [Mycena venus]
MRSRLLGSVFGLALTSFVATGAVGTQPVTSKTAPLPPLSGKHGGVATEVAECSSIGVDTMKAGGNAADAILASALCVGVIAAYHSGIGGGGFMLVRFPTSSGKHAYEMIDFRETMPAAGNETMYVTNSTTPQTLSTIGGLAVGVPGELRGWEMLHKRHGRLPWKSLFQPAIKLARDGFVVNGDLASAIALGAGIIPHEPLWAEAYAPNGTLLKQGDTCYRKRYADTLEQIAEYGADAFYTGKIATNIVEAAFARGGIITTDDLANYSAIIREPVNITYRNSRIFSTVAPSSGAVVLSALKIFEGYQGDYNDSDPEINVTTHRLIEATQFAYGQRTQYGDPAFTSNVTDLQNYYLTDAAVADVRSKIVDNTTFPVAYYDPSNYTPLDDHGTSHMAAIDQEGIAISLTTTINFFWGSQVMTTDGIILNDEMDDFSSPGQLNGFGFAPSPINFIRPGKRPQSSIASSIAEDLTTGEVTIATGSAGGSRIITATLQQLHHYIDQGMGPEECTHQPRWHDQLSGVTFFEVGDTTYGVPSFPNSAVAYLNSLGYNTTTEDLTGSTSHVVARAKNGTITAASDPRKAAGRGAAF